MKIKITLLSGLLFILFFVSCTKKTDNPVDNITFPVIESLTASKSTIQFGGSDPTVITCEATGGLLSYTWQVDLGDLIPMNNDKSIMQFTASECCLGNKFITCTVENSLGSITDTISIYIALPE